jgi:uncharacterized protein YkwD
VLEKQPTYSFLIVFLFACACYLAWFDGDRFRPPLVDPSPPVEPEPYEDRYQTYELIRAHNGTRRAHGLPELDPHVYLIAAARAHAEHMAARGRLAHSGIGDGSPAERAKQAGYRSSVVGENIGWNYRDITAVMSGWMHSPGHRANILGGYDQMGAAVAYGASGEPYWCAVFGRSVK